MEDEEKEEAIKIASPWRKCDTPLWPVENGEWLCGETFAQEVFSILQSPRMGPPPFKESVPRPHSPFSENGKKEV
jgi:hypothetical protein